MKKILLLIPIVLLSACAYKIKEPIQPLSFIAHYPLDTTKIKFDGFYTNTYLDLVKERDDEFADYSSSDMIIFNGNNKVKSFYYILTKNNDPFNCDFYTNFVATTKKYTKKGIGNFTIKNDSIYAYVPIYLALTGHRFAEVDFNYRGYLKSKDTITDWKVIKAYPKDITKNAISLNPRLFEPQTMYFVKSDAVKCLEMD